MAMQHFYFEAFLRPVYSAERNDMDGQDPQGLAEQHKMESLFMCAIYQILQTLFYQPSDPHVYNAGDR